MKKLAYLTMVAASAVFFACGSEPSFYDQLTDEQKEMVSFKGYKVKMCFDIPLEDFSVNPNDSLAVGLLNLRTDLESLNVLIENMEVEENGLNPYASLEKMKAVEKPFPAMTYSEPLDDNISLFYFYSVIDKEGYAFDMKNDWYEELKEMIMPAAVNSQIINLESQDWRTSTTPEEQFVTVMVTLVTRPDILTSLEKFTTITIDGKPHRVLAHLVSQ